MNTQLKEIQKQLEDLEEKIQINMRDTDSKKMSRPTLLAMVYLEAAYNRVVRIRMNVEAMINGETIHD